MKLHRIVLSVVIVILVSAFAFAGQTPSGGGSSWKNPYTTSGSFGVGNVKASWNTYLHTDGYQAGDSGPWSSIDMDASLDGMVFGDASLSTNTYSEDPAKFYGTFSFSGGFGGPVTDPAGHSNQLNFDSSGKSLGMTLSSYYTDYDTALHLSASGYFQPAFITSTTFQYSEFDRFVGWDYATGTPVYEPGWGVTLGFYGSWILPTNPPQESTNENTSPIPEPATVGIMSLGSLLLLRRRGR